MSNPMEDEWRLIKVSLRRTLDQMIRDAFLGSASTASASEPRPLLEGDIAEMARALSQVSEPPEDLIHMIVITIWAPTQVALKCRYEEKWYVLINKLDWPKVRASLPKAEPLPGLLWSTGITVVEDDELARKILVAALANSPKFRDDPYWSVGP